MVTSRRSAPGRASARLRVMGRGNHELRPSMARSGLRLLLFAPRRRSKVA